MNTKKKKQYKIMKSELFKSQEKKLPKEVKKELKDVLKSIAKNPTKAPNTMNLFSSPKAEELVQWMSRVKPSTIDLLFEYLGDKRCLNKKGSKLAHEFWNKYIKEKW